MKSMTCIAAFALIVGACAANPPQQSGQRAPGAQPGDATGAAAGGDTALIRILANPTLDREALALYERREGGIYLDRMGEVAEDERASILARIRALEVIAAEKDIRQFVPVRVALHAQDPRVRATALATANTLREAGYREMKVLLDEALDDPAPEIQVKALQFVGDEDIERLRAIVSSDRPAPVLAAARGLLQAMEERGAPLVPDAAGVLQRTSASGHELRFTPSRAWSSWGTAVGRVAVTTADGRTIALPRDIEAVAYVVPVFFSSDGAHAVYEADRTIHVLDIATGTSRTVGAGIAPRVRPLTEQFLYLEPDTASMAQDRGTTRLSYSVLSTPFAGGDARAIGKVEATLTHDAHGNASPVRWMEVVESDGAFFLSGEGISLMPLPSPFGEMPGA